MTNFLKHRWGRLLLSDLASSTLSLWVLLWRGRRETGHAAAPVNAVSHWLWSKVALRQNKLSARYTLTGAAVHYGAAMVWCGLYEWMQARRGHASATNAIKDAVLVTAVAAVVDLAGVPDRLTPGFERRLLPKGLVLVYAAFAAGLAIGGLAALSQRNEHARTAR